MAIRMERAKDDIDLQVANPLKNVGQCIEWNVDMRVTISNVKRSKMFQRSRNVVIVLLAIGFAVILSHLKREVRALQVQMQYMNSNLLVLMSRYDRLNRNLNRAWIQRTNEFSYDKNAYNAKRFVDRNYVSKVSETFDEPRSRTNGSSSNYDTVIPLINPVRSLKVKFLSDTRDKDNGFNPGSRESPTKLEDAGKVGEKEANNVRGKRSILTLGKNNTMGKTVNETIDGYPENDSDLDVQLEIRSGRSRRDEGRGKKWRKNKRRPKRSRRRLGPLVATFVGAIPEQHVTDTVYVGPWVESSKNDSQYSLNKFHLVEDRKSIEVTTSGLYMISAQIFYFGEPTNYSYWILLSSEGKSKTQKLVKCSTASSISATEVSCYTSVITFLHRGDRLHIQQQEKNRLVNMREGHSYIQLLLLSNNGRKKRLT